MKTKKSVFRRTRIKTEAFLTGLRGIPQSHIKPKYWADNLYASLDFKARRVTDATGPMMHIFKVYDPISRMLATETHFRAADFDRALDDYFTWYKPPVRVARRLENGRIVRRLLVPKRIRMVRLSKEQKAALNKAKRDLRIAGMEEEMIDQIELAAQASGKAILDILVAEAAPAA